MKGIVATNDQNAPTDDGSALASLIRIIAETEERYSDESLSRVEIIRTLDDAIASADAVATACPTDYIQRSARSLVLASETLKKAYGWRPPRVPNLPLPDSQLSFIL